MATPLSASKFLSVLQAEGLATVQVGNWRTHNRNTKGPWGPMNGVLLHHTGSWITEAGMVQLCYNGRSDLPGPLCHGVITKDGAVHLVGYGRANHAGLGSASVLNAVVNERSVLPAVGDLSVDGNRHFYGFEAVNRGDGIDPYPAVQVEAMVRVSAALLRAHGWGTGGKTSVLGHLEWQVGKPDPRGAAFPGMNAVRDRVAERLLHPASWSPNGASTTATYTVKTGDTLYAIALAHKAKVPDLAALNHLADPGAIKPGQVIRLK
jgi:hypothetical protein